MLEKPSHAVIWVAKTYPPWQSLVLTTLKSLYEVKHWTAWVLWSLA